MTEALEPERSREWTNTTVAYFPFLAWNDYKTLRRVDDVTLTMPLSPFFSLFLAPKAAHVEAFNRARGVSDYAAGDSAVLN